MQILSINNNFQNKHYLSQNNQLKQSNNFPQNKNSIGVLNALSFMGNDRITEKELCQLKLKNAIDNQNDFRFGKNEMREIYKELAQFKTKVKKSLVLDRLLKVGLGDYYQYANPNDSLLSAEEIKTYLKILSSAEPVEQAAIIDVIEQNKTQLAEKDIDSTVFYHLENNPNMIKTMGKVKKFLLKEYPKFSSEKHKDILLLTFDILACQKNDEYQPYLQDMYKTIVKKLAEDENSSYYAIELAIESCTEKEFKKIFPLINNQNEHEILKISETYYETKRKKYVDDFIKKYSN